MSVEWTVLDDEERGHDVYLCGHLRQQQPDVEPASLGCEDCSALGEANWVSLRVCLTCGHVGCCDSSRHRHARSHYASSHHALVGSFQPAEGWGWCYADDIVLVQDPPPTGVHTTVRAARG
jgi:CPA2 family monovalent cation:H+ antiporter-2